MGQEWLSPALAVGVAERGPGFLVNACHLSFRTAQCVVLRTLNLGAR